MVIHVYHPYRQPDAPNHCLPLNGQCSHICLPAPQITANSAKTSCACPRGLKLDKDNRNCIHDGKFHEFFFISIVIIWFHDFFRFNVTLDDYVGLPRESTPPPEFRYKNEVDPYAGLNKDIISDATTSVLNNASSVSNTSGSYFVHFSFSRQNVYYLSLI